MYKTVNGVLTQMTDEEILEWEAIQPTTKQLLQEAKDTKCKEIDAFTKNKIVALVGNGTKQRNLNAKSTQLALKELRGTITDDEQTLLNQLNDTFEEVESLIVAGNTLENEVQAMETIGEIENVKVI